MKNRIYEKMREYGWHLNNDTNEDFESVYNIHYNNIQDLYDFLHLQGDYEGWCKDETCIDLNDLDQQKLTDIADFMSDFLRALNDIDYDCPFYYIKESEK